MVIEIEPALVFLCLLGICLAVLFWDARRQRRGEEDGRQTMAGRQAMADLQLRVAELAEENRHLREQVDFLEKLARTASGREV